MDVFEELNIALNYARPGNVPPAPEFRHGRAGDPGNRRFARVLMYGDSQPFLLGKGLDTAPAIVFANQQFTLVPGVCLHSFDGGADALRNLRNIRLSYGRYRN